MGVVGILHTQMSLEKDLLINLDREEFCTTVGIMKIVLLIILQENHNWKAKKKEKKEKKKKNPQKNNKTRQSNQGILMNNHLFMCRFVDDKRGREDVSEHFCY